MGIANIINTSTSSGGGEIIRELINSSDGQGLHFDGVAGRIDVASPPDLGTEFSFEFVLKADSFGSSNLYFVDFGNGGRFIFGTHSSTSYNWAIFDNTAWNSFGIKVSDDLKVHHLVVTVDGTAAVLYDNGNQVGTTTINAGHGIDSCSDLFIGSAYSSAVNLFNGSLYRCRFYNKTLTQSEIDTAYQRADVPFESQYGSETDLVNANSSGSGTAWTGATGTTAPTGWSPAGSSRTYTIDASTGDPAPSLKIEAGSANVGIKWGGTATLGKQHRVTFSYKCGDAATTMAYRLNDADSFVNLANSTSWATATVEWTGDGVTGGFMLRVNESGKFGHVDTVSIRAIGCTTDLDLAFSNPSQSLMVQNRASDGASPVADGTATAGVSQTQKIVQLNATALAVSAATARTPSDGAIVADNIGAGKANPTYLLETEGATADHLMLNRTNANDVEMVIKNSEQAWTLGIDRSDSNEFVIATGESVGSNEKVAISSAGLITAGNQVKVTSSNAGAVAFSVGDAGTGLYNTGSNAVGLATNGVQRINVTSSGVLGVGNPAPNGALEVSRGGAGTESTISTWSTADVHHSQLSFEKSGSNTINTRAVTVSGEPLGAINAYGVDTNTDKRRAARIEFNQSAASTGSKVSGDIVFKTSNAANNDQTRLMINSLGYSLFGCTSVPNTSVAGLALFGSSSANVSSSGSAVTAYNHWIFVNGNGTVGSISSNGSATAFTTSSDYRLKENLTPLTGALDRIEQLPVYRFNFKADSEKTVDGFVAHEAQAIVPEAVTGEKDAMKTVVVQEAVEAQPATYWEEDDELPEGKSVGDEKTAAIEAQDEVTEEQPDYQGIDQSKLLPVLWAAVRELKAKVEALENA